MRNDIFYEPEQAHRMARAYAKAARELQRGGVPFSKDALATAVLMIEDSEAGQFEVAELGERAAKAINAHRRFRR